MQDIICPNPNCGYKGQPKREGKGSAIVLIVLLCFFILPGILYAFACGGARIKCPKCGLQLADG